ncbi:TetR/AcrR family transcriptional regulator [Reinekea marinisedimentorum]|uniref:AcrR family transcriptional regulator n=1 Tax=Reinekea marinisedimentorum TaxID=230495 RepID=A0A4R3I7B4_9GAMM|nr:TetR/AcrR family transcriptional regulator [Reinekea marinisedimentorum]TCS42035.1 AcrR family transcriptional regulator [Reinekea marinisedimentorum]
MSKSPKFDREQVVAKATNLYWERGYHATSMRNLQDAIDMRPGSIYAAFGSKDGVFRESLEHYAEQSIGRFRAQRAAASSPLQALKNTVRQVVIQSKTDAPSSMCMLVKTVAELTDNEAELLEFAKAKLKSVEDAIAELIKEAQQAGEISAEKNAEHLARFVQVQIAGLRIYAKANDDAPLEQMISEMFESITATVQ